MVLAVKSPLFDFTHLKRRKMFDGLSQPVHGSKAQMKEQAFLDYFMNRIRKHLGAKAVSVADISHDGDHTLKSVSMLVTYELKSQENTNDLWDNEGVMY